MAYTKCSDVRTYIDLYERNIALYSGRRKSRLTEGFLSRSACKVVVVVIVHVSPLGLVRRQRRFVFASRKAGGTATLLLLMRRACYLKISIVCRWTKRGVGGGGTHIFHDHNPWHLYDAGAGARRVCTEARQALLVPMRSSVGCSASRMKGESCVLLRTAFEANFGTL